ncbi:MAG: hypothetical protein U0Q19_07630 [Kineosporiaceae bacterium]
MTSLSPEIARQLAHTIIDDRIHEAEQYRLGRLTRLARRARLARQAMARHTPPTLPPSASSGGPSTVSATVPATETATLPSPRSARVGTPVR